MAHAARLDVRMNRCASTHPSAMQRNESPGQEEEAASARGVASKITRGGGKRV